MILIFALSALLQASFSFVVKTPRLHMLHSWFGWHKSVGSSWNTVKAVPFDEGSGRNETNVGKIESIEEMVANVENLARKQKLDDIQAEEIRKKTAKKKKSDKEYDEFWNRQGKKSKVTKDMLFRAYYSLKKNETIQDKLYSDEISAIISDEKFDSSNNDDYSNDLSGKKLTFRKVDSDVLDNNLRPSNYGVSISDALLEPGDPVSPNIRRERQDGVGALRTDIGGTVGTVSSPRSSRDATVAGLGALGAVLTTIVGSKVYRTITSMSGASSLSLPLLSSPQLDARRILKDFSQEDLHDAVRKLYSTDESFRSLPDLPPSLFDLRCINGDNNAVREAVAQNKVIVVAFWRPTDILSVRTVASLEQVQRLFPKDLLVVTVFSPKFDNELSTIVKPVDDGSSDIGKGTVSQQSLQCNSSVECTLLPAMDLPSLILEDPRLSLWRVRLAELRLQSWPTVLLTLPPSDNKGTGPKIAFVVDASRALAPVLGSALAASLSGARPIPLNTVVRGWTPLIKSPTVVTLTLNRPMRVAVDNKSGLLYVSDTGNNRVLEISPDGLVLRVFGSTSTGAGFGRGARDGVYPATFSRPIGLAVDVSGILYVADSGNDEIKRIKLSDGTVSSISVLPADRDSDGQIYDFSDLSQLESTLGSTLLELSSKSAEEIQRAVVKSNLQDNLLARQVVGRSRPLLAPTDIAIVDAFVYVSATGSHQIWRLEGDGFFARPALGSGIPGRRDCQSPISFLSDKLRYSAPTGLASSRGRIYVADADAGTVRAVDLREGGTYTALAGDRFEERASTDDLLSSPAGDVDGFADQPRFRSPAGMCRFGPDSFLLADTLNNKVKLLELKDSAADCRSRSLIGTGKPGNSLDIGSKAELCCPQGVAYDRNRGRIYIADTGNNRICAVDEETLAVTEVVVKFPNA